MPNKQAANQAGSHVPMVHLLGHMWDRLKVCDEVDLLLAHGAEEDGLATTLEQQQLIKSLTMRRHR